VLVDLGGVPTGEAAVTVCIHCNGVCRLTDGREVYPHRTDLADKPIWKCKVCPDSTVGCHPGGTEALGFAANKETRNARMKLHNEMLDPLWRDKELLRAIPKKQRGPSARRRVYAFLSAKMDLPRDETHTGMWTIEQCRQAWKLLRDQSPASILEWFDNQRVSA
jgi:zinc-finger-containing domain